MAAKITHQYLIGRDKRAMCSVAEPTQELPKHLKTIIDRDGYDAATSILCSNNWVSIDPWEDGTDGDVIVGYGRIALGDERRYNMSHDSTKENFTAAFKITSRGIQAYRVFGRSTENRRYRYYCKHNNRFYEFDASARRPFPAALGKVGSEKIAPVAPETSIPSPGELLAELISATPSVDTQLTDEHRAEYMRIASFALACAQR